MKTLSLSLVAVLVASCAAPLWMDPIKSVGPGTYQITHTMYAHSATKGVRQGTIDRAKAKCAADRLPYTKLREEMTPGGTLSYTLTFTCNNDNPSGI